MDPNFKDNHYLEPVPVADTRAEGYVDRWIVYGKVDGEQLFTANGCGACHTLAAAGASGNVGPNLDQLKPSKATVIRQVTNGGAVMPAFKGKLTAAQIQAVAQYVLSSAGK